MPVSGRTVCDCYILINSQPFILQKIKIELRNLEHSCVTNTLGKGTGSTGTKR